MFLIVKKNKNFNQFGSFYWKDSYFPKHIPYLKKNFKPVTFDKCLITFSKFFESISSELNGYTDSLQITVNTNNGKTRKFQTLTRSESKNVCCWFLRITVNTNNGKSHHIEQNEDLPSNVEPLRDSTIARLKAHELLVLRTMGSKAYSSSLKCSNHYIGICEHLFQAFASALTVISRSSPVVNLDMTFTLQNVCDINLTETLTRSERKYLCFQIYK